MDAASFFPVGGMPTASSSLKDFSPKSQDTGVTAIERGGFTLWLIVISTSGNRPLRYQASPPGAGYGQFEHKADSLIAKFKEAGGTVREIDVWARVTTLSHALVMHIIMYLSWAGNPCRDSHYLQNRRQCEGLRLGEPRHWHADASAWCCCSMQNTRRSADARWKPVCVMMLPLVVVGYTSKQSVSQCVKPPPPAWIMQPPRLADTAEPGLFHPQREGWSLYAKTTGRNPEVY